jgi:hypothetical protein
LGALVGPDAHGQQVRQAIWETGLFTGRQNELNLLREELASPRPSLGVIYGRRRVGKRGHVHRNVQYARTVDACVAASASTGII